MLKIENIIIKCELQSLPEVGKHGKLPNGH